jgi:hypothetical protein
MAELRRRGASATGRGAGAGEPQRPGGEAPLHLGEADARAVLLVGAIEDADRDGAIVGRDVRERALDAAAVTTPLASPRALEAIGVARARRIADDLAREHPALHALRVPWPWGSIAAAAAVAGAIAGATSNAWGPERGISILAFPLGAILAWNLAAFAALAIGRALRGARAGWLAALAVRVADLRSRRLARRAAAERPSAVLATALSRYARDWSAASAPLLAARVRAALHAGAAALAAGAIGGLYAAGIALEFRATWESTWLEATTVQAYVDVVLGPASRLAGIPVPDVEPLRGPAGSGPAGPWIHLWATTIGLAVVVPRAALAALSALRAARLARRVPVALDRMRVRRALTLAAGGVVRVDTVFYACEPTGAVRDRLAELVADALGSRARFGGTRSVAYGDPAGAETGDAGSRPNADASASAATRGAADGSVADVDLAALDRATVVVFPAAQTPEEEVHGRFLDELRAAGHRIVAVLDRAAYAERAGSEERMRERTATWDRLFRAAGLDVAIDPGPAASASGLRAWTSREDRDGGPARRGGAAPRARGVAP